MYRGMQQMMHGARKSADNVFAENRFLEKTNETFERYVFNMRKQRVDESVTDYISALCNLASSCNFCDCLKDSLLRDRIVSGIKDGYTRKRLLQEHDLNLETCIAMCRATEASSSFPPVKTVQAGPESSEDQKPAQKQDFSRSSRRCDQKASPDHDIDSVEIPEVFFHTEFDDDDDDDDDDEDNEDSPLQWPTRQQSSGLQWNKTERNKLGWSMDLATQPDQPSAQPVSDNAPMLSQDSTHPCYLCRSAFVLVSSLELHLASVHGEKLDIVLPGSSTPDRCDAGHVNKGNANSGKDRKNWCRNLVCDLCSKSFLTPSRLKAHKLNSICRRSFDCDECEMKFPASRSLTRHKKLHKGERIHKCPECQHDFKTAGNLKEHIMAVHIGAKPHLCDICGAAFPKVSNLTRHKRVHTGEKPHLCPYCGKGFADSSTLRQHRFTHTGEKKVCCPHCPMAFVYSVQLKRHLRKMHQLVD